MARPRTPLHVWMGHVWKGFRHKALLDGIVSPHLTNLPTVFYLFFFSPQHFFLFYILQLFFM